MRITSFEGEFRGLLIEDFGTLLFIMTFFEKKIKVTIDIKFSKFNPF